MKTLGKKFTSVESLEGDLHRAKIAVEQLEVSLKAASKEDCQDARNDYVSPLFESIASTLHDKLK